MPHQNGNVRHNGHLNSGEPHNGAGPRPAAWEVRVLVPGLPLQSCSVLLTNGAERLVVDTGFPQHDALLLDALRRAGVAAADVTGVVNTHHHLDHCGANFLFPNAWVYGSKIDFDWAVAIYTSVCGGETRREKFREFYPEAREEEFDRMDEARVLQLLKWMWDPAILGDLGRYRWCEQEPLALAGLHPLPTPGHTPGHFSLRVDGTDGAYLIAGDARPFANDDAAQGYDMPPHNAGLFRRSRRLVDEFEGLVIPGHDDPFVQSRTPVSMGQRS
jgi:glyoxylase-like metal-dependent hydrolase (beta-lactamase superfamily II)